MPPAFWKYLTSLKGGEKFVLMWAHIASELDKPYATFSFQELMLKFKIPRSSFGRHIIGVRQFLDKSGTNLGQTWVRGGVDFQPITNVRGTNLGQTWDKVGTKVGQVQELKFTEQEPAKKRKPKAEDEDFTALLERVIDYLNDITGKRYRASNKQTKQLVKSRVKEGYTYDDFKLVIDNKSELWRNTAQEMYLRPATLFGNKFDSYLNEKPEQKSDLFMHSKISNHNATKDGKWKSAFNDAEEISYAEFVESSARNQKGDTGNH